MTLNPKHGQFAVDAGLQEHLAKNGAALSELISAINYRKAITALSKLLSGDVCCSKCQTRDVRLVLDCLSGAFEVSTATRPDFDATVRWQGARMADVHSILAR